MRERALVHPMMSVLQSKNGDPLGGLIHVSLHPNFKRDDLLRLLHLHGTHIITLLFHL